MVLLLGVAHPNGENSDYDGLYLKDNELDAIATELVGKPLLLNHDDDSVLGRVVSAWAAKQRQSDINRSLFALTEIHTANAVESSLIGSLASKGYLSDFSLGHDVQIQSSSNSFGSQVVSKHAVELSLCKRGARDGTHVYMVALPAEQQKQYISSASDTLRCKASISKEKMSEVNEITPPAAATAASAEIPAAPAAPAAAETPVELSVAVLQKMKALEQDKAQLAEELERYREAGRKEREAEVNQGGVRHYIEQIMASDPSLAAHESEIKALLEKMISSDNGTGLVKILRAAASKHSNSVVELEKAYQAAKAKDEQLAKIQAELNEIRAEAFSTPAQRVIRASASASSANEQPPAKKAKTTNSIFDELTDTIRASGPARTMPVAKLPERIVNMNRSLLD